METCSGLSYNTLYYVFLDQAPLTGQFLPPGGTVTYQFTTTKETAMTGLNRAFVGSILTPRAGAPDTTGNNDGGAGAQVGFAGNIYAGVATVDKPADWSNVGNAMDGDQTTYATGTLTGLTSTKLTVSGFNGIAPYYKSVVLNVKTNPTAISGGVGTTNVALDYSLDGGNSWVNIYVVTSSGTVRTDTVTLSQSQNIAAVQVRYTLTTGGAADDVTAYFYEAWLSTEG